MQSKAMVHGKQVDVTVHQKSKSVWIASLIYLGEHYSGQGRSSGTAIASAVERARYATN